MNKEQIRETKKRRDIILAMMLKRGGMVTTYYLQKSIARFMPEPTRGQLYTDIRCLTQEEIIERLYVWDYQENKNEELDAKRFPVVKLTSKGKTKAAKVKLIGIEV